MGLKTEGKPRSFKREFGRVMAKDVCTRKTKQTKKTTTNNEGKLNF